MGDAGFPLLDAWDSPGDDTKLIRGGTGKLSRQKWSALPARALRWLRWRAHERLQPMNACRGVYPSFSAAELAAPGIKPVGYDAANSSKWYLSKLTGVSQEDYPVLFWLRSAFDDGRSVFEIGGHVGVAYYSFASLLVYPPDLIWTICDVPSIAEAGEALALERGRTNLRFVTSPTQVEGADIVLAAGALQYIDSPDLAGAIASFRRRPRHVLINTTPVYDGAAFITLQNIGSAYCPYRVFNRGEFVRSMETAGYLLVDSWRKERAFSVPGHPDKSFDHYSGFYFRSK
jgi:putative methyltransferase (TIGR04325 family)